VFWDTSSCGKGSSTHSLQTTHADPRTSLTTPHTPQVRVWNYLDKTCRMKKQFEVDVTAVTLHPSGLYVVVGLSDKLRLFNITSTDLVQVKEFHVPGCHVRPRTHQS
jgi:hypothetical protein